MRLPYRAAYNTTFGEVSTTPLKPVDGMTSSDVVITMGRAK